MAYSVRKSTPVAGWQDPRLVGRSSGAPTTLSGALPGSYDPAFGGIPGYTAPGRTAADTLTSNIANLPQATSLGQGVNRYALNYLGEGIPNYAALTGQLSSTIGNLLNPNDPTAMADVSQRGAENAVGSGVSGAPIQNYSTYKLRQADIERRAALANNLLSGAASRLPQPFNIASTQVPLNEALALQNLADVTTAAPVPAAAYRTNLSNLMAGTQQGRGGGGGSPSVASTPTAAIDDIIRKYLNKIPGGSGIDPYGPRPFEDQSQPNEGWGEIPAEGGSWYTDPNIPPTFFPNDYSPFGTPDQFTPADWYEPWMDDIDLD
jgi:hypothetical protein